MPYSTFGKVLHTSDIQSTWGCASQISHDSRSRVGAHLSKLWPYTGNWAKSKKWVLFPETTAYPFLLILGKLQTLDVLLQKLKAGGHRYSAKLGKGTTQVKKVHQPRLLRTSTSKSCWSIGWQSKLLTNQGNLLSVLLLKWLDKYNTDISHIPFSTLEQLAHPSTTLTNDLYQCELQSLNLSFTVPTMTASAVLTWYGVNKLNFHLWTSLSSYFSLLPRLHPPSPPFSTEFWSLLRWHGCWMFWKSFLTTMATPTFVWMEPLLSRRDRYTAVHVFFLLSSECNMMQTLWYLG